MDFKKLFADLIFSAKKGWANTLVAAIAGVATILHKYGIAIDADLLMNIQTFALVWLGFNTVPGSAPEETKE